MAAIQLALDDTFDISNYGGKFKLFDASPIKVNYSMDIPQEAKTPEGLEIQKMAKSDWEKEMKAFKSAKEKEYKQILAFTEDALMKSAVKKKEEFSKLGGDKAIKALENWLKEEVKGANVMISNALKTFEGIVQKAMLDFWDKAAKAIDKKFKSALTKQKVKAVFKIIAWSGVIIVAAAASIAAGVIGLLAAPTGVGPLAAAGVIFASVVTIAGAVKKIIDTYSSTWPDHKKSAKTLIDKSRALQDALAYEKKKADQLKDIPGRTLGPKEKIKLMLGNVKGKKSDVESGIKDLGIWTAKMMQDIEKAAKAQEPIVDKMQKAADELAKAKNDKEAAAIQKKVEEYKKHLAQEMGAINNARIYLRNYATLVIEGQKFMADETNFDPSKLGAFINKLQDIASSKEMENLITLGKAGVELYKALDKLLKK
jgi:hypothetical protein